MFVEGDLTLSLKISLNTCSDVSLPSDLRAQTVAPTA